MVNWLEKTLQEQAFLYTLSNGILCAGSDCISQSYYPHENSPVFW